MLKPTIVRVGVVLLVSALSWPVAAVGAQAPRDQRASSIESGVDTTVRTGDDFFAYANGAWLNATVVPAGKDRWGARDEINDITSKRVAELLDDARTAKRGSLARKVADFREAYLNELIIEGLGLAPVKPLLDNIDGVRDRVALARLLGSDMRADVDPMNYGVYNSASLIGLSVERSTHGEKNNVAFLLQGGLGLPDRTQYLSGAAPMQALRMRYLEYITRMLTLAGFDSAQERAKSVLTLETAIAQSHATDEVSSNTGNADNVWTIGDLAREAPGIDWPAFFEAAGLPSTRSFVAWQPTALKGLASLVATQSLETWKNYLRFRVLDHYADVLPRAFSAQALAMHSALRDQASDIPRSGRALDATQAAMSEAIGRMYSDRYFSAAQKARVREIVSNVTAAFIRRVDASSWMSPSSKTLAVEKLRTLYVGIGYPDRWQDYSDLTVDPLDAFGNLRRAEHRQYEQAIARIGKPIDRTEWLIAPHSAGAILVFEQNAYDFSAALLQAPKFDSAASDAAAYGAIGAIIGHDVTHFVDLLGSQYDLEGRTHGWWTKEDSARFQSLANPLVNQVSEYQPFPDRHVDGKLTETENIADLGGLAAAFDAYRLTLGTRVADRNYVKQRDREFFIAFAQAWRARLTESGMRKQLATDHAPESYRVATVRNLDAWYDAFDVRPGQQLYLAPSARVHVW
jgi:putative endopeptidase